MKSVSRWLLAVAAAALLAGCAPEKPKTNVEEGKAPVPGQTGALTPGQAPGTPTTGTGAPTPTTPPPAPAAGN